jgi:dTDP-4-dehydrorhamnose 3,5-epimerase
MIIMGKFKFTETGIKDMFVVEPTVFEDNRGYFMETFQENDFKEAGHDLTFVQDNQSKSSKGVLRGLHLQLKYPQGKLVRVIKGEVFDVGVDLRGDSPTYGKWYGEILSEDNKKQLYIPPKFAHGFLVLSDEAEFLYKCTEFYHGEDESGIRWDDEDIAIDWPLDGIDEIILSDKDKEWKSFKDSKIKY